MKVGRHARGLALAGAGQTTHEDIHLDVVAAFELVHRVQGLVDVADEMHDELQGFDLLVPGTATQVVSQAGKRGYDAIAALVVFLAVPIFTVLGDIDRNVDKMPIVGLGALVADVVGPAGDGGERMPRAQQRLDGFRSNRRQPALRHFGHDRVALLAPCQRLPRQGKAEYAR